MKQSQARIVVPREERIVSVRPADISLCHNTTNTVQLQRVWQLAQTIH